MCLCVCSRIWQTCSNYGVILSVYFPPLRLAQLNDVPGQMLEHMNVCFMAASWRPVRKCVVILVWRSRRERQKAVLEQGPSVALAGGWGGMSTLVVLLSLCFLPSFYTVMDNRQCLSPLTTMAFYVSINLKQMYNIMYNILYRNTGMFSNPVHFLWPIWVSPHNAIVQGLADGGVVWVWQSG